MEKFSRVIEIKSNFREKKLFYFHLLQTFYRYLRVTHCNAVNRLLDTETTKLSLGDLNGRSWCYTRVYIAREEDNLHHTTGEMVQVYILSITISNLGIVAWHVFFENVTK